MESCGSSDRSDPPPIQARPRHLKKSHRQSKKKKRRRGKRERESCYICRDRITPAEKYYPCNCYFGFVHQRCLREWMQRGHRRCGICNLRYHLNREPNKCYLCHQSAENSPLIRACKCKYLTVHQDCLNHWYQRSEHNRECRYCGFEFQIHRQVTRKFTTRRIHWFSWILLTLVQLTSLVLIVGGTSLICPDPPCSQFTSKDEDSSQLLFPNTSHIKHGRVLDVLYLFPLAVAVIGLMIAGYVYLRRIITWYLMEPNNRPAQYQTILNWFKRSRNRFKLLGYPLLVALAFQLLGNIHYQFYWRVGIIPDQNHFWVFNRKSFLTGPAGLILVSGFVAVPVFIIYLAYGLYRCFYLILIKETHQVTIMPNQQI